MANYCDYEIHVKGSKKAALIVYATSKCAGKDNYIIAEERGDDYVIHFTGDCKWNLDAYCEHFKGEIDLEAIDENDFDTMADLDLQHTFLRDKSRILHCEIEAHSWSDESGFDAFEHYKDGEMLRCDRINDWSGEFDYEWYKEEYPIYEDFCDDFGIDPEKIPESLFEEKTEGYFVYHKKADKGVEFEFDF